MKLLIISNMAHYYRDNQIVGWGPTVEEIDHLATLFDEVRHIGCLHNGIAPLSALPYMGSNIKLISVPPAGGSNIWGKLSILKRLPLYIYTILKELNKAEAVHLRCPANIPLIALICLIFRKKPKCRWAKYAGNWQIGRSTPLFFRFQHCLLKHHIGNCEVTVNGTWPKQQPFIHTFQNPCLSLDEINGAYKSSLQKELTQPLRLIFVGALNTKKGVYRLLEISFLLQKNGILFILDIIGDGVDRQAYEAKCLEFGLRGNVFFHGWVPKSGLCEYYQNAHINLLPSESEGWPKALSEGMAYGVVPVAGAVSSIPQTLNETQAGVSVPPFDVQEYVQEIIRLTKAPEIWKSYSLNALATAPLFTYKKYLHSIKELFKKSWDIELVND